jgi:hypothetical protein
MSFIRLTPTFHGTTNILNVAHIVMLCPNHTPDGRETTTIRLSDGSLREFDESIDAVMALIADPIASAIKAGTN